jgi:hypothetical protein
MIRTFWVTNLQDCDAGQILCDLAMREEIGRTFSILAQQPLVRRAGFTASCHATLIRLNE